MPFLYPSRELLRAYQQGELGFEALALAYREELEAKRNEGGGFQEWLKELPGLGDVTLLCFERAERPCHRRVAAQWLVEQAPELRLGELR